MNFRIRHMTLSDVNNVYAIEKEAHTAPWTKELLKDCVMVGYDCRVFELEINNDFVCAGYIIIRPNQELYHILNFCIAKNIQLKGYGRKFLQEILHLLSKEKFISQVVLEVRPSNKVALHLYKSMGFEQIEIKKNYYKEDGHSEDAIFLQKRLKCT